MTNTTLAEYAQEQAQQAREQLSQARERVNSAKTSKARNAAYEDVEFWGNKLAFVTHAKV